MVFGTSSTTTVSVTPTHISPMIFEGMRLMKAQGGFKNKAPAANGAAIIWKKKMKEVKHWKGVRKYDISERMGEGGGGEGFQGYRTMVADWPLPLACSPSLWMLEKREVSLLAQCTLDVGPGRVNVKHSWIGHFTVTMTLSLSIRTNKWVPANGCWNSRGGWEATMMVFHPILIH